MGDLFVDCYFSYSLQDLVVQTFFFTFFLSFSLCKVFCCVFCFSPLFCFICSETYYYKGKNSKLSGIKRIVKKRKRIHKFSLSPIPFPLVLHMEIVKKLVYLYTLTPFYHPLPVISTPFFLQSSASQFQTHFLLNLGNSC